MATIGNEDLTQASGLTTSTDGKYTVTGTGVFDDLMEAVNTHLEAQFNLGRLKGTDYATVYLGAIQSSLQNSVQFVLGKQQADKQADLLEAQTIAATQQKDIEILLKRQQIMTESLGNGLQVSEYSWAVTYIEDPLSIFSYTTNENLSSDDVKALMMADPHVAGYTVNTVVAGPVTTIHGSGSSTAATMIAKTEKEIAVLEQKRVTEYAQTEITATDAAQTPTDASLMGRQATLYEKQAAGFEWDAKNSYNKNITDILKIQINTLGTFTDDKFVTVEDLIEPFPNEPAFDSNSSWTGGT